MPFSVTDNLWTKISITWAKTLQFCDKGCLDDSFLPEYMITFEFLGYDDSEKECGNRNKNPFKFPFPIFFSKKLHEFTAKVITCIYINKSAFRLKS